MDVPVENLIVEIEPQQETTTMANRNGKPANRPLLNGSGLEDLIRQGAKQVIQQAIEAELAELLNQYPLALS